MKQGRLVIFAFVLFAMSVASVAKMRNDMWMSIPFKRLFANVQAHLKKNPKDANAWFLLGRLHTIAFVGNVKPTDVISCKNPSYTSVPVLNGLPTKFYPLQPHPAPKNAASFQQLLERVKAYQRAIQLNPNDPIYYLGLGWAAEQAISLHKELRALPPGKATKMHRIDWIDLSLDSYRKSYQQSRQDDLELQMVQVFQSVATKESGEGILRNLKLMPQSDAIQKEMSEVRETTAKIDKMPRWISPIVIPLDGNVSGKALTMPGRHVRFDLAAFGFKQKVTWVKPNVGILVWDPGYRGKVYDGQQLFGNRTWQMFFSNGYQPMAALDDNRDGQLSGRELQWLSLWVDANSNGRVDPGEVKPLAYYGITALSVKPVGKRDGLLWCPQGATLRDGRRLPTFDWIASTR